MNDKLSLGQLGVSDSVGDENIVCVKNGPPISPQNKYGVWVESFQLL